jgi:hypothetical protein
MKVLGKRNGNSKLSISLDNYMMMSKSNSTNNKSTTTPDDLLDDSSDDDYRDLPPPKCWDSFDMQLSNKVSSLLIITVINSLSDHSSPKYPSFT